MITIRFSKSLFLMFVGILTLCLIAPSMAAVTNYTIKSGDTLSSIARKYYGNSTLWTELQRYNNIPNADKIYTGDSLQIPDSATLQAMQKASTVSEKMSIASSAKSNNGTVPSSNSSNSSSNSSSSSSSASSNSPNGPNVTPTANNPRGVSYDALNGLDVDI